MTQIDRKHVSQRMSQIVVYGDTVYLAGQVAHGARGEAVGRQTQDILNRIDGLLAEAGTNKARLLSASVWLTDVATFDEMNAVWDAWVAAGNPPARACVEARLADPAFNVEIMVTAAI